MSRAAQIKAIGKEIWQVARGHHEGEWDWFGRSELDRADLDGDGPLAVRLSKPGVRALRRVLALEGLTALRIGDCRKLSPKGLGELLAHDGLTELHLVYAKLDAQAELRFPPALERLSLNSARPHPDTAGALRELPNLRILDSSHFDLEPACLPELPALEAVELRGWTTFPAAELARCPGLRRVGAWGVPAAPEDMAALEGSAIRDLAVKRALVPAAARALPLEAVACEGPALEADVVEALAACATLESVSSSAAFEPPELERVLDLPRLRSLAVGSLRAESFPTLGDHSAALEELRHMLLPDNTSPPGLATPLVRREGLRVYGATNWHPDDELAEAAVASTSLRSLFVRARGNQAAILEAGGWSPRDGGRFYVRPDA